MTLDELTSASLEGTLVLASEEMELVQMVEDEPILYRGPGRISQAPDGKFVMEMTATTVVNTDMIAAINASMRTTSGLILGDDRHFRLSFMDEAGRQWRADHVRPNGSWHVAADPKFTEEIRVLRTEGPSLGTDHLVRVLFLEDLRLPYMPQSRARFPTERGEVDIHYENKRLDVALRSTDPLSDQLSVRLEEALRFLTAEDPTPRLVVNATPDGSAWAFHSPLKRMGDNNMRMPIASNQIEYMNRGWQLFTRYLDYVVAHGESGYWHPLTYHLHNAGAASGNSIDAWAVGVSVATEGVANLVEMPLNQKERGLMKRFRKWLAVEIKGHDEFSSLTTRVVNMLSGLGTPSTKDRLHHLAQNGIVTEDYVRAWGRLRNTHVHPRPPDLTAVDDDAFQELIDQIFQVTTLLHEIAFHLIGYDGPYQDYGARDFPVRLHRPAVEPALDPA